MDERPPNPLDTVLSVFVYAPIGFLLDARELLPQLTTRGRQQVELLKVAAKFAVAKGKLDAEKKLRGSRQHAAPAAPSSTPPVADPPATSGDVTRSAAAAPSARKSSPARRAATRPKAPVAASARRVPPRRANGGQPPIASYDTLSAMQILPRLATLDRRNLDVVYDYERTHRGRRTILGRIEQLRAVTG